MNNSTAGRPGSLPAGHLSSSYPSSLMARLQGPSLSPMREGGPTWRPSEHPEDGGGGVDAGLRQTVLLLSSVGRSGSSFLGEVLASQGRNIYFYEPVRAMPEEERVDSALVLAELRRYFHCELREGFLDLVKEPYKAARHPATKGKAQGQVSTEEVQRLCRKEPLRIIKTIRTRLQWAQELLDDAELNLKVIHLVRDPRGSTVSMAALDWKKGVEETCKAIQQDLQLKEEMERKYPDRYFFVKYEEYCLDPYSKTRQILRFLRDGAAGADQGRDQEWDQREYQEGNPEEDQLRNQEWDQRDYQEGDQLKNQERNQEGTQKRDHNGGKGTQRRKKEDEQKEHQEGEQSEALDAISPPPSASEDLPAEVLLYLDSHVHITPATKRSPWTTARNTSDVHQQWRSKITQTRLTKAEDACRDVILRLNYTLFGSVALARNMSVPVFDYYWSPAQP
ncbi:carbohydrate sulfotransferase 3-like isoform X2 [Penaeus chinensis]|nr:carbohydrate sulfotransferase 3-like isoform X2 [Penaeus chinensis]